MSRISFEYPVETKSGEEAVFFVSATVNPFVRAVLNPVDLSHPAEGGDVEDIELELNGKPVSVEDAVEMGLNQERLEERIYEEAADRDDYPDPPDPPDREEDY